MLIQLLCNYTVRRGRGNSAMEDWPACLSPGRSGCGYSLLSITIFLPAPFLVIFGENFQPFYP